MAAVVRSHPVGKAINLAIHRDLSSGRWFVDQVDVRTEGIRSVTQFTSKTTTDQAFTSEFLALLKPYLPTNLNRQVRSMSGEAIKLDALILEDLRVLTQSAANGIQRVIIRFNRAVGRIYDILTNTHRPDEEYLETQALSAPKRHVVEAGAPSLGLHDEGYATHRTPDGAR